MSNKMEIPSNWGVCEYQVLLDYIQPTNYIVETTEYSDSYLTPVLTAGKSFIKGFTNESHGIFENLPVIIFDDFTTATKYVNFTFKVKSSAMKILTPSCKLVNLKFLYYRMQVEHVRSDTHKRYWISVYAKKQLLLPPEKEQHRIVAKIEELFSELDKGIESLKTAREQLKVYRQALLKHAFEGKLTEQWRKDNAGKLESASDLLSRIQQEREARYQQQLDDWKVAVKQWETEGKEGKKPSKPAKTKPINVISNDELASLPIIPSEWIWCKYGDLCSVVRNGISKKPVGEQGEKIFRISAVRPMFFNMTDYRIIDNSNGAFDHYFLLNGDLVFTRYNGSRRYVGVCAAYKSNERHLFPDKLVQTRPDLPMLSTSYIEKSLNSGGSRKFIESMIRTTAGQSGVSGGDIKNIPVPICSQEEQIEIASNLDASLSVLIENELLIESNLLRSEALRQSILKKAFSGQLVPQDLNDEPASVLLERIKTEKAEQDKQIKARKTTKRTLKA